MSKIDEACDEFDEVLLLISGLKGMAWAASGGATHSGSNEGRIVVAFGDGVVSWCDVIQQRMERLWALMRECGDAGSEVSHAVVSGVSHAKTAEVSHANPAAA